jgi:hypothetical protein
MLLESHVSPTSPRGTYGRLGPPRCSLRLQSFGDDFLRLFVPDEPQDRLYPVRISRLRLQQRESSSTLEIKDCDN